MTGNNDGFRSKALDTGKKFSKGGKIDYHCALRPHMKGKEFVKS
jgi:hypothetical protein